MIAVYTYTHDTVVTLTVSANEDSTLTGWSGACSGMDACVVTMTATQNVMATFDFAERKVYLPFIQH